MIVCFAICVDKQINIFPKKWPVSISYISLYESSNRLNLVNTYLPSLLAFSLRFCSNILTSPLSSSLTVGGSASGATTKLGVSALHRLSCIRLYHISAYNKQNTVVSENYYKQMSESEFSRKSQSASPQGLMDVVEGYDNRKIFSK